MCGLQILINEWYQVLAGFIQHRFLKGNIFTSDKSCTKSEDDLKMLLLLGHEITWATFKHFYAVQISHNDRVKPQISDILGDKKGGGVYYYLAMFAE